MFVEVEDNLNVENSVFLRFKEVSAPRLVSHVRIYDRSSIGEWYTITGWGNNDEQATCDAYAQKVEDSGSGVAILIYGGIHGVRLKAEDSSEPWDLKSPNQWGETYLLLSGEDDVRFA
ncbi:MAG: hypothetical protein MRJ96_15365 [Nitrospirales bacterium]|nr:hypothetical protein [Nitrospira sp.]MDR4502822.1 hypothetical protein [Nitrospirales bacterium]